MDHIRIDGGAADGAVGDFGCFFAQRPVVSMGTKGVLDVFAAVGQRQFRRHRPERGKPDHGKRLGFAGVCRFMDDREIVRTELRFISSFNVYIRNSFTIIISTLNSSLCPETA